MSRVESKMSRVEGTMSRVEGKMSRVEGYLSRVKKIFLLGRKCNRNIQIRAQFKILECITIVKESSRKVLKHVHSRFVAACNIFRV